MKAARSTSSTSISSLSSGSNGTKATSRAPATPAQTVTSPVLRTKTLPTPVKGRTTTTPAKTPGRGEKPEVKPITIPELYAFIKRQIFSEPATDPERDVVIRNKMADTFKDLNLDEDLARTRERIAGPCEAARAESLQVQEDSNKQVTILRRKFLEEEAKNQKLQNEVEALKSTIQDQSNRLVLLENSLSMEKHQSAVLLERMIIVERESLTASKALENTINAIGDLRKSAIIPAEPTNATSQHSAQTLSQQVQDAENAIKNLTDIMRAADISPAEQAPFQDLGGDLQEDGEEELEEDEAAAAAEGEPLVTDEQNVEKENGSNGESEGEYSSEDDEVIHIGANGKPDHQVEVEVEVEEAPEH